MRSLAETALKNITFAEARVCRSFFQGGTVFPTRCSLVEILVLVGGATAPVVPLNRRFWMEGRRAEYSASHRRTPTRSS